MAWDDLQWTICLMLVTENEYKEWFLWMTLFLGCYGTTGPQWAENLT